jgi:hypothetical protein
LSTSWLRDVEPWPAILVLPEGAASLDEAHAAIELWEYYSGKRLDPAQRLTVEVMMAQASDGTWAASTTGRCMPRQNGKGDEIEVPELWGLVQRAEAILHTVHDAVLLASQAQQRLLSVLEGHADLRRLVKRRWLGTGQQMVEMRNGGVIWYRTRTNGGGRGVDDIDRLVVDEAQHAADEHLAALTPTMLANPNAQLNALGSAGIAGKSAWWWRQRCRALGPDPGAFGWVEHTAEKVRLDELGQPLQEPVDPSDRALWEAANPALVAGRGQGWAFFEEQYQRLDPRSYAREHLGVWDPPDGGSAAAIIPRPVWAVCHKPKSGPSGDVEFALDVSPNRDTIAFAVGAASGLGGVHVEVVEHGPHPGVRWICDEAKRLQDAHGGALALVKGSPAHSLKADLEAAGVRVREIEGAEYVQSCGDFYDAVLSGEVRHLGQSELDDALVGADRKWSGDSWYWARRQSTSDITPLVAVTIARWAHLHANKAALSVW